MELNGETSATSKASCAPPHNRRPDADIQAAVRFASRTCQRTKAPASRQADRSGRTYTMLVKGAKSDHMGKCFASRRRGGASSAKRCEAVRSGAKRCGNAKRDRKDFFRQSMSLKPTSKIVPAPFANNFVTRRCCCASGSWSRNGSGGGHRRSGSRCEMVRTAANACKRVRTGTRQIKNGGYQRSHAKSAPLSATRPHESSNDRLRG